MIYYHICPYSQKNLSLRSKKTILVTVFILNGMTILDNYKKFSFTVIVIRIQPLGFRLVEVTKDCDAANSGKLLHRGQFP